MATTMRPRTGRTGRLIGAREIVIMALCSAIYAILGIAGAVFSIAPGGVTLFYLPAIFIIPAGIWFGVWGVLGALFGTLLFSPYFGYGFALGGALAIVDLASPGITAIATRLLKVDAALRHLRSYITYAVIVAIAAAIEAVVGTLVLWKAGLYSPGAVPFGILVWWTGVISAALILSPILLRVLTPFFKRTGLFHPSFLGGQGGATFEEA
jgi:integral membrane sensor domain MASE1